MCQVSSVDTTSSYSIRTPHIWARTSKTRLSQVTPNTVAPQFNFSGQIKYSYLMGIDVGSFKRKNKTVSLDFCFLILYIDLKGQWLIWRVSINAYVISDQLKLQPIFGLTRLVYSEFLEISSELYRYQHRSIGTGAMCKQTLKTNCSAQFTALHPITQNVFNGNVLHRCCQCFRY